MKVTLLEAILSLLFVTALWSLTMGIAVCTRWLGWKSLDLRSFAYGSAVVLVCWGIASVIYNELYGHSA